MVAHVPMSIRHHHRINSRLSVIAAQEGTPPLEVAKRATKELVAFAGAIATAIFATRSASIKQSRAHYDDTATRHENIFLIMPYEGIEPVRGST